MFEGALPVIFEHAKRLRNTMTDAEAVLYDKIKDDFSIKRDYSVLRFTNHEVMTSMVSLIEKITEAINNNICKQSPVIGG